jgi:hypothetical protein
MYCFSTATVIRERASILRYMYIACRIVSCSLALSSDLFSADGLIIRISQRYCVPSTVTLIPAGTGRINSQYCSVDWNLVILAILHINAYRGVRIACSYKTHQFPSDIVILILTTFFYVDLLPPCSITSRSCHFIELWRQGWLHPTNQFDLGITNQRNCQRSRQAELLRKCYLSWDRNTNKICRKNTKTGRFYKIVLAFNLHFS